MRVARGDFPSEDRENVTVVAAVDVIVAVELFDTRYSIAVHPVNPVNRSCRPHRPMIAPINRSSAALVNRADRNARANCQSRADRSTILAGKWDVTVLNPASRLSFARPAAGRSGSSDVD